MANINGATNAIFYDGSPIKPGAIQGEGAGGGPTSSAVWSDILTACYHLRSGSLPMQISCHEARVVPYEECRNNEFIRMTVTDELNVLGGICKVLGDSGVSINQTEQLDEAKWWEGEKQYAEFIVDTDPAPEKGLMKAIKALELNSAVDCISSRYHIIGRPDIPSSKEQSKLLIRNRY